MQVTVKCYGAARAATGRKSVAVEATNDATVGSVLDRLGEEHPEFADARDSELVVMRRGSHVDETDPVEDGDVVSVSNPPMVED